MSTLADHVRLIRLDPVDSVSILMRIHRDGFHAQLVSRTEGPDSDLTAVGDQHLGEHASNLSRDCYCSETVFRSFLGWSVRLGFTSGFASAGISAQRDTDFRLNRTVT